MREAYAQFEARQIALVVVSSTELEMTSYVAEVLRAPYPVVSDSAWEVFQRYGMGSLLGVPLPGTFLIDAAGIIRWSWAATATPIFTPPSPAQQIALIESIGEA